MMAVRDSHVVHASEVLGHVPLKALAAGLVQAIEEAEVEGGIAEHDPAVMVFGAFIAFHTHADVMHVRGYHEMIEKCRERHEQQGTMQ